MLLAQTELIAWWLWEEELRVQNVFPITLDGGLGFGLAKEENGLRYLCCGCHGMVFLSTFPHLLSPDGGLK